MPQFPGMFALSLGPTLLVAQGRPVGGPDSLSTNGSTTRFDDRAHPWRAPLKVVLRFAAPPQPSPSACAWWRR